MRGWDRSTGARLVPADEWFWLSGDECGSSALILTEASGCLLRGAVCPAQLNSPRCDVPWPPNPLASGASIYLGTDPRAHERQTPATDLDVQRAGFQA
jgi:hypothetical protein